MNDNNDDVSRDEASFAHSARQAVPYYHSRMPYSAGGSHGGGSGVYGAAPYNTPYAAAPYGGGGAYGQQPYGGNTANEEEGSLFGTLSITRILRVCRQRWITIAVFVVVGAAAAFVLFRVWTPVYEAVATFELTARKSVMQGSVFFEYGMAPFEEQANTTMFRMQGPNMLNAVVLDYHIRAPSSPMTDDQLKLILIQNTKLELRRHTRLIDVTVRSTDREVAANLANAFVQATETYSQTENRLESEKGVKWLESMSKTLDLELNNIDREIANFKARNTVDIYLMQRDAFAASLGTLSAELLRAEIALIDAGQIYAALQAVNEDPNKFASLPDGVPRMEEIGRASQKLSDVTGERNALLTHLTPKHPDVMAKEKEVEVYSKAFSDVLFRSMEAAAANMDLLQRKYDALVEKQGLINREVEVLQSKIDTSISGLDHLMSRREICYINLQNNLKRVQESNLSMDQNMSSTSVARLSGLPEKPVEPKAIIILPAGTLLGLILGLVFVLLIDHLEDQVTSIADIEQRLHLKALAIVPHVRWKSRWEIALASVHEKFSHFAEAFAGLRNLLESPRYREFTHVIMPISTQPGEGKTITACNLALSYAISGKKVLLVDFDMRRPRQARIFKKSSSEFTSLAEVLMKNDSTLFDSLVVPSGHENLSLVLSKPSSKISPASLMGTGILSEFFIWARKNFDKVILDSPPFGIVSDTVALGSQVDCVLMLACPNRSHFRPLRHAVRYLTEAGTRIVGAVINDVDFGHGRTFAGYDYHYRYAYQYKGKYSNYLRPKTAGDEEEDQVDGAPKNENAKPSVDDGSVSKKGKAPEKHKGRRDDDDDSDE